MKDSLGLRADEFQGCHPPKAGACFPEVARARRSQPSARVWWTCEHAWGVRVAFVKTGAAVLFLPRSTQGSQARSRTRSPEGLRAGGSACCPPSGPVRRCQGPGRELSRRGNGRPEQGRGAERGRPALPRVPPSPGAAPAGQTLFSTPRQPWLRALERAGRLLAALAPSEPCGRRARPLSRRLPAAPGRLHGASPGRPGSLPPGPRADRPRLQGQGFA